MSSPGAGPGPRYDGAVYPEPTYLGEGGEVTARLRPAGQVAELETAGGAAAYLATGASTGGRFGLYRWDMGPEPSGPGPHFHRTISESFFVLSGAVRIFDGRAWTDTGPGDFCYVPEGGIHAFRNESGAPASMLILFAPGAPREGYFEGLVAMSASDRRLGKEEWERFFRDHDNHWV